MRIVLLGTGFAVPSKIRVQAGILLETEENKLLLDCGSGVLGNLAKAEFEATDITHIFLTHLHVDHSIDLLSILKARMILGETKARVYGPNGVKKMIESQFAAYHYLDGRFELEIEELKDGDIISLGNDKIICASACHSPESIAYRIESGASVIYTGDTEPCAGVKSLIGKGVDILIHECSLFESSIEGHTNVKSLGEFLEDMPVKRLVLTHFSSEIIGHEEEMVKILKQNFSGDIVVGKDLLALVVP